MIGLGLNVGRTSGNAKRLAMKGAGAGWKDSGGGAAAPPNFDFFDVTACGGPAALLQATLFDFQSKRGLGRLDEARALDRAFVEIIPRPIMLSPVGGWLLGSTASSLLLEDRSLALTLLRAEPPAKAKSER